MTQRLIVEVDGEQTVLWETDGELVINHTGLPLRENGLDGEQLTGDNGGLLYIRMYQILSSPEEVIEHDADA